MVIFSSQINHKIPILTNDGHHPINNVGENSNPNNTHEEGEGVPASPIFFPTVWHCDCVYGTDGPAHKPLEPSLTPLPARRFEETKFLWKTDSLIIYLRESLGLTFLIFPRQINLRTVNLINLFPLRRTPQHVSKLLPQLFAP